MATGNLLFQIKRTLMMLERLYLGTAAALQMFSLSERHSGVALLCFDGTSLVCLLSTVCRDSLPDLEGFFYCTIKDPHRTVFLIAHVIS